MPSVAVVWKGNCHDPRTGYRLLGHLHRLAARSDEYLRLRQPERPRILDVMNQQRGGTLRARGNIESVDQDISGSILISSFISPDPEALVASAREAGITLVEDPKAKDAALIAISNARLRGIDFKLFDPRGLYPDADRMSFAEIEIAIADFAARARENKLSLDELKGGTFTISNGGVYGSLLSTPIINPPQSAILGIHATRDRPVAENGQVVIRPINYLALSYDHRIIDGREAVLALVAIKEALEDPSRLLLEL